MIINEGRTCKYVLISERAKENPTKFLLKEMNSKLANEIDNETTMVDRRGYTKILVGLSRELKIKNCLVGWEGMKNEKGEEIPCTNENKFKIPGWAQEELVSEINRISFITEEDEKK